MNELIPSSPTPLQAAIFCVLPFLSLYALARIWQAQKQNWFQWNQVTPLPFSVFEMLVILSVVALTLQTQFLTIFLPAVCVACAAWYCRKHGLALLDQWGLHPDRFALAGRSALNTYFALLLPIALASWLSMALARALGTPELIQPVVKKLLETGQMDEIIGTLLLATLFAPLWEEMVFRGLIYPWLKTKLPRYAALILSAIFFAAIHNHLPSFLPLALLGLALAALYEYTGSLLSSIVLHSLFNFATCLNLLLLRPS